MPDRVPKLMDTLGCIFQKMKEDDIIRVAEFNIFSKSFRVIALDAEKRQRDMEKESAKHRNEGNQYFKQGNYQYACNLYTMSIASALQGPICALAYANRSAALFNMCKFEECLEDIERAINNGYGEKLLYKLYLRKARCLKLLGRNFRESFKRAHEMIEKYNKDDLPKLKQALEHDLEEPMLENAKAGHFYSEGNLPPLSYGVSEEVPCFSSAVSVAYSKKLGRHLIANRDIEIGDVLIVEEPIAAVVDLDKAHKMCCRCLKISCSLIPCSHCRQFMYCGKECLDSDWEEGHKDECSMLLKVLGFARELAKEQVLIGYAKRNFTLPCLALALMVRSIGLSKMKEAVLANEVMSESYLDPRTRGFKDGKFTYSLEALLSLTSNFDKISTEERKLLMSFAIDTVMQVPSWDNQKEAMTALFIKLYLICTFNFKPIALFTNNEMKDVKENKQAMFFYCEYGFGLYLASSLVNHSCSPNMIKVNYGKTAVYRASKPIKKGDQLTETFYTDRLVSDRKTRHEMLKKFYKFDCTCEACINNWPLFNKLKGSENNKLTENDISFLHKCTMLTDAKSMFSFEEVNAFTAYTRFGFPVDMQLMPKLLSVLNKMHAHPDCEQFVVYHHYRQSLMSHYHILGGAVLSKTAINLFTCKQKETFPLFASNLHEIFMNMMLVDPLTFFCPA